MTVNIYRSRNKRGYTSFVVAHSVNGRRRLQNFAGFKEARAEATAIADKLNRGELQATQLTGADRIAYGHALAALRPTGVPLELAAQEFAEAKRILDGHGTLVEAAHYYAKRRTGFEVKLVAEAIAEMLRSKEQEKASAAYRKALGCYLKKLNLAFNCPVSALRSSDIGDFLRKMPVSNRSKKNARAILSAFFAFCRERRWIAPGEDPLQNVPSFRGETKDVQIYTLQELAALLAHARSELIPYLTIAAFAGLRSAELQRLDWSNIDLDAGIITVQATKAKTASRRVVPAQLNLKASLLPYVKSSGRVVPFDNIPKQLGRLAREAGIRWIKNGLRHSFCSYRLAVVQDSGKVAYEAGNSSTMIYRHYHELVRPADAQRWFKIETVSTNLATF